jgi:hypothetical protein
MSAPEGAAVPTKTEDPRSQTGPGSEGPSDVGDDAGALARPAPTTTPSSPSGAPREASAGMGERTDEPAPKGAAAPGVADVELP